MKTMFDINLLNSFVAENCLEIIGDYNNLTRTSIIKGKCKTIDCNNEFRKSFRTLFDNKSFYCKTCMTKIIVSNIQTSHLKNCGFITNLKCPITKEKIRQTNLIKYGCEYNTQSQEYKEKTKQTNLKKYGVEFVMQSKMFQDKSKETNLKNYGVEYPSQNAEYAEKHGKNCYNKKEYTYPSGNLIKIQGYENYALDFLLQNENINEEDIVTGCKNVPTIWYMDENGKKHRHYVDIFIPPQNRCIEVKSTWTAEKKKDCIFLKQNAAKEIGHIYEIWVYDRKGNIIEKYL